MPVQEFSLCDEDGAKSQVGGEGGEGGIEEMLLEECGGAPSAGQRTGLVSSCSLPSVPSLL